MTQTAPTISCATTGRTGARNAWITRTVLPASLRTVPSKARVSVCMETTAVNQSTAREGKIIKISSQSYIPKSCHVLVMYTKITQPKVVEVQEIIVTLGLVYLQIFSFEYLEIQKSSDSGEDIFDIGED